MTNDLLNDPIVQQRRDAFRKKLRRNNNFRNEVADLLAVHVHQCENLEAMIAGGEPTDDQKEAFKHICMQLSGGINDAINRRSKAVTRKESFNARYPDVDYDGFMNLVSIYNTLTESGGNTDHVRQDILKVVPDWDAITWEV